MASTPYQFIIPGFPHFRVHTIAKHRNKQSSKETVTKIGTESMLNLGVDHVVHKF